MKATVATPTTITGGLASFSFSEMAIAMYDTALIRAYLSLIFGSETYHIFRLNNHVYLDRRRPDASHHS